MAGGQEVLNTLLRSQSCADLIHADYNLLVFHSCPAGTNAFQLGPMASSLLLDSSVENPMLKGSLWVKEVKVSVF